MLKSSDFGKKQQKKIRSGKGKNTQQFVSDFSIDKFQDDMNLYDSD